MKVTNMLIELAHAAIPEWMINAYSLTFDEVMEDIKDSMSYFDQLEELASYKNDISEGVNPIMDVDDLMNINGSEIFICDV